MLTPQSLSENRQLPCPPKRWILLVLFIVPLLTACDAQIANDTTEHRIVLVNESGTTGCVPGFKAQFRVWHRNEEVFADIDPGERTNVFVNVVEGETINVDVREPRIDGQDRVVASSFVAVRTEDWPGVATRTITFCRNFSLIFDNF